MGVGANFPSRSRVLRLLTTAVLAAPSLAAASGWQSSLVFTSDYVHRGVSQSDGEPAMQGSVAFHHPVGWYAGAWVSSVDTARRYYSSRGAQSEVDAFIGFGRRFDADWTVDVRAVRYAYLDDPAPANYDYTELAGSIVWRQRLRGSLAISPDSTAFGVSGGSRRRFALAGEVSWSQPLTRWISGLVGIGYHDLSDVVGAGYFYGGASLALQFGHVTLEAGHTVAGRGAERVFGSRLAGSRTMLTASVNF